MSEYNEEKSPAAEYSANTRTPAVNTCTNASEATGNGQEANRRRPFNTNKKNVTQIKEFKGDTIKLNGNVFQVHSERKNESQFMDSIEALRVYSSVAYKSDIEALTVLFTKLEVPTVVIPADPTVARIKMEDGTIIERTSKFEEMEYAEHVKQWIRDNKSLKATIRSLYNIVWGQFSKIMKNKLSLAKTFINFEAEGNVTELLKEIRRVGLQIETNTSVYDAMDEAKSLYCNYRQEHDESNTKRLRNFRSVVEAIEHLGGAMFVDKSLIDYEKELDNKNPSIINRNDDELKVYVREKLMAVAFLKRAKYDYKKLMTTIRDQHTFGIDVYPSTLHDAYELMENHSSTDTKNREEEARKRREREMISGKGRVRS